MIGMRQPQGRSISRGKASGGRTPARRQRGGVGCHVPALVLSAALLSLVSLLPGARASGISDVEELVRVAPTRNMGSPYRQVIDDYVARRFQETGFETGEIVFQTPAYVPGRAELRLAGGEVFALHTMAPNLVHPGNLPEPRWAGSLVDLRGCEPEDLKSASVRDSAALLDVNWRNFGRKNS